MSPLKRRKALRRSPLQRRTPLKPATPSRRPRPISAASPEQRAKVKGAVSIVSGREHVDPAHVWPRGLGGCSHPDCVVPLTRDEHRAYDEGRLDLLPFLVGQGRVVELQHALGHTRGDLIGLLNLVTGERWAPEARAA